MFMIIHNGVCVDTGIEQLDRTIAAGHEKLVLVDL